MFSKTIVYVVFIMSIVINGVAWSADACPPNRGVALQVLGSGGPIADDGRASSGYLVWVNGRSRALIDAGGGVFLRFGEAGASFGDLDVIGLSHLHTDHSSALPALLKSGNFAGRRRTLVLAGPGSGGPFPGTKDFAIAMLDANDGAYAYLSGYLTGGGRLPLMAVEEFPVDAPGAVFSIDLPDGTPLELSAIPVPHGIVPALGFKVSVGDIEIVFGSDQNGSNPAFAEFAKGADVLVLHLVIPENADEVARRLHATPSRVGEVAAAANPRMLVLSHFMARSLRNLDANVARVREHYPGPVHVANDLDCVTIQSLADAKGIRLE